MKLRDYNDKELIYELVKRGYTVASVSEGEEQLRKYVNNKRSGKISDTRKSTIREVNDDANSNMFMNTRQIEEQARIGVDVLYGMIDKVSGTKKVKTLHDVNDESE